MAEPKYTYGTGKRKCAIARVKLLSGNGNIVVNGRAFLEYFPSLALQNVVLEPFKVTGTLNKLDATVKVEGGGVMGQAGALRHGIARALVQSNEGLRSVLRQYGLLTRDARIKERKKYGLKRARKAPQYTKR
ncbi:MAG: 30S ribosomal protein S9 [Chloroflexi bacterium RBG_13_60_13]|nr:MAG: 30S ribosomal protein S9 [Chloroflexi bacterium RBG_13_60_13]